MSATDASGNESHATATYDLMSWNDDQRKALEMHLHGADVTFGWQDDGYLVVAEAVAPTVEEMIEVVESTDSLEHGAADQLKPDAG